MRKLVLIFQLYVFSSCQPYLKIVERPADYSAVVKGKNLQGVIFSKSTKCFECFHNVERFSPTLQDIEEAERILKNQLKEKNSGLANQGKDCPVIHRNLHNYTRQYFGYIDEQKDSIVYTTFDWNKSTILDKTRNSAEIEREGWKKERIFVFDGCSHFWVIKINITDENLFDLNINGVG